MYILYYFEQNYDESEFLIIKASNSKEKLELMIDELDKQYEIKKDYNRKEGIRIGDLSKSNTEIIKNFLNRNRYAMKNILNESVEYKDKWMENIKYGSSFSIQEIPEWKSMSTTSINAAKDTIIKYCIRPYWGWEIYLCLDQIHEPLPELNKNDYKAFNGEQGYSKLHLNIQEIDLI